MAMPTLIGTCCASNVSLGAFPRKLIGRDKFGCNKKNFLIWFELNLVKALDLFFDLFSNDLTFCQLMHILTLFFV